MSRVAVVILNYNGVLFLREFLPPLIRYNSFGYDVIVADNASSDDSLEMLKAEFENVRIIEIHENLGFAGGYNHALEYVDNEYVVLLNSDVEVTEGWLEPMVDFMDQHTNVGACQPKLRSYDQKSHFEYAGACGGFLDYFGFPFCRGRVFSVVEEDRGQYDENKKVFWATGACMLVRNQVYKNMGGLDDRFFAHMEEIDLCWRINAAGLSIFCIPQSLVYHVGGGTLATNSPRKVYLNFRNSLLMLYKNLENDDFKQKYRARLFFDFLAIINFTVTLQWKLITTVFKAHIDFKKMSIEYEKMRTEGKTNLLENKAITFKKSVVWEFFLKGKTKFSLFKF